MCMNLSLAHVAGRVTDGGGGRRGTGDGPLSPPRPGWSQKFAQRENACHPCPGRQGRHCRVRAEAQDISRNQEMPAPRLAPPPSDCPRAKATLPKPSQAERRPLPPHSPSPACSVAWEADPHGQPQRASALCLCECPASGVPQQPMGRKRLTGLAPSFRLP